MYWCKSHFRICCNYLFRGVNTGRTHPTSTHLSNWLGGWKWNFCDEVFARLDRKYVGCEIRCVSATVAHRCKYRIVREAAVKRTQIEYVWYGSGIIFFESFCISWSKLKYDRVGQSVESALIALAAIFLAHSAYFNNFRQKIPYFDASQQKRVLFNCFATKQCLGMLKMWG